MIDDLLCVCGHLRSEHNMLSHPDYDNGLVEGACFNQDIGPNEFDTCLGFEVVGNHTPVVVEARAYTDDNGKNPIPQLIGPFSSPDAAQKWMHKTYPALWGSWNVAPLTYPEDVTA